MNPAATRATATAPVELPHVCPKHVETVLTHLLRGGSGWCNKCNLYQQSANHPMPVLDPEFAARRETAMASERKAKTNAKAKARRTSKKTQTANESPAASATR